MSQTSSGRKAGGDSSAAESACHAFIRQSPRLALVLGSIAATLVIAFFFCPRFAIWNGLNVPPAWTHPELNRANDAIQQLHDPFGPVANPSNWVIAWRLLLPLIWTALHLPVTLYLILPHVGCIFAVGMMLQIAWRVSGDFDRSFYAAVALGASPWFFVASGWLTYYDSWIIAALLAASFVRSRVVLGTVCLLAPWVDERFLVALPLCCIIRSFDWKSFRFRPRRDLVPDVGLMAGACVVYATIRVILMSTGHGGHAEEYAATYFSWTRISKAGIGSYLHGLWSGLRAAWLFVVALLWILWKEGRQKMAILLVAAFVFIIAVVFSVAADLGRATSMAAAPLGLLGVVVIAAKKPAFFRTWVPIVMTANVLLPGEIVVTEFVEPIRYFYAELDQLKHLPASVDPANYARQGLDLQKQGKLAEAKSALDCAIQLDAGYTLAYVQRASVEINLNEPQAAETDLQQAFQLAPESPDAYLGRAMLKMSRGDASGAASDVNTALRVGPADWPTRKSAESFLAQLNGGKNH